MKSRMLGMRWLRGWLVTACDGGRLLWLLRWVAALQTVFQMDGLKSLLKGGGTSEERWIHTHVVCLLQWLLQWCLYRVFVAAMLMLVVCASLTKFVCASVALLTYTHVFGEVIDLFRAHQTGGVRSMSISANEVHLHPPLNTSIPHWIVHSMSISANELRTVRVNSSADEVRKTTQTTIINECNTWLPIRHPQPHLTDIKRQIGLSFSMETTETLLSIHAEQIVCRRAL